MKDDLKLLKPLFIAGANNPFPEVELENKITKDDFEKYSKIKKFMDVFGDATEEVIKESVEEGKAFMWVENK